jgi:hypothetical protein
MSTFMRVGSSTHSGCWYHASGPTSSVAKASSFHWICTAIQRSPLASTTGTPSGRGNSIAPPSSIPRRRGLLQPGDGSRHGRGGGAQRRRP